MDFDNQTEEIKKKILKLETPFFLFDLKKVGTKYDTLDYALKPDQIYYAVKCNSLPEILHTLDNKGSHFEINNIGEVEKIQQAGINIKKCINSSPFTPEDDIKKMYNLGIKQFCFDSKKMIKSLARNAPDCDGIMRIYSDNSGSRFELSGKAGVIKQKQDEFLAYAKQHGLNVKGISFHVGSQCYDISNWSSAIKEASRLFNKYSNLEILNIGGGLPIKYNGKTRSPEEVAAVVEDSIDKYFDKKPILQAEPGRYLVGDTAITGSSVKLIKNGNMNMAIVDASVFAGHIEIIENGKDFAYPLQTTAEGENQIYQIGGSTCAGTDIMDKSTLLPKLSDDSKNPSKIFFLKTGAYTYEYIRSQDVCFNGAKKPKIYFMENGEIKGRK